MNFHEQGWASLKHGGLLISAARLPEFFPATQEPLSSRQIEQMRRAVTAFDGSQQSLVALLDYVLEDLSGLPAEEWQKAQGVEPHWSVRSFTGVQIRPRRVWLGPGGAVLPVFVPEDGASRQFSAKLGVGRSRQLLSRVVEWLRLQRQPLALVTNGRQWRLVHAGQDYDAWCEWDIDLWFEEGQPSAQVLAWRSLLNRQALQVESDGDGLLVTAIRESRKGQSELSAVLGERVRQAVEELITASHAAIEQAQASGQVTDYKDLYIAGSRIIMRCIITLFAEARELLPVDNPVYQQAYSLGGLRQQLDRRASGRGNERLTQGRSAWPRLIGLFNLIHYGSAHEALPVPQYGGALFAPGDPSSEDGIARALALLEGSGNAITDRQVWSILNLLARTRMRVRQGRQNRWVQAPVDFSTLSSEYIGILYEGLLDFELKQVPAGDPILFLAVGNQPALPLSQLEAMDDKAVKQLFEALKKAAKSGADDEEDDEEGAAELEAEEDAGEEGESSQEDTEEPDEVDADADEAEELILTEDHLGRANAWLERAAQLAGLVKKPRGRRANQATASEEHQQALARAARQLCARMIAPGQFYLVRWGGTRKGAGTFYTRPQLAAPTVRRTLQPLAFEPVRSEQDARTGLETVVEWAPRRPESILALKVCDPAMGSGSFLAGSLRYLTDALVQSLYHYGLIEKAEDGGVPRLADGQLSELLSDELTRLNPADDSFESALRGQIKRHIVERCLYGVDLDPLAVELGRMALWVETMDRDLPFGFLDHKLKVGNALVGAWFDNYRAYPAMAWQREGGDKDYQKGKPQNLLNHSYVDVKGKQKGDVFTDTIKARSKGVPQQLSAMLSGQLALDADLDATEVHDELLAVFQRLHALPVHESEARAELYQNEVLNNPHYHALKARMDLWCALWFWPGEVIDQAPLPDQFNRPTPEALRLAGQVAAEQRFFHWELEFPDVFTCTHRGFDAVLGNPPWEIQKPNSKEFFSNHDPLYRAYGKQEALDRQLEYFRALPALEHEWIAYMAGFKAMSNWAKSAGKPFGDAVTTNKDGKQKHDLNLGGGGRNSFAASSALHAKWQRQRSAMQGFADPAHPFLHQGSADLNTYKLFLELSQALLRDQGRLGMIVPSGIYTDKGTTALRELFLEHCDWQWLFGFENREGIFDIHRSFKFCPLVVQKGGETRAIRAAFMHRNVDDWDAADSHVLAYPRERVLEFSPFSKAILEIRSERDLEVLQKIYANGVLLGDQSEQGWGVKYATEFHMTNDSRLFPPRPKWEAKGYQADEYGHWLKGPWQPYGGPAHILDREPGLVLSRDGSQALRLEDIEDVALPLYEGRMIGQFDFSEKGWVSGKGRKAVWREIPADNKVLEPQYLMGINDYIGCDGGSKALIGLKAGFLAIGSATNSRSMFSGLVAHYPAGNSVAVLQAASVERTIALMTALNSYSYDYVLRNRLGGLNLNYFVVAETALPYVTGQCISTLEALGLRLGLPHQAYAQYWISRKSGDQSWKELFALTLYERLRQKAIVEAVCAYFFGLEGQEFMTILESCDLPMQPWSGESSKRFNPKGFWRIDKDKDPELRHTVLSLIAFHELQEKGLDAFLSQNDGEGWMIPETLRLADYGLGHDDRAREHQPVASRLGPRFYDWQLEEDVARSWEECAAHAELIRRIVPLPVSEAADEVDGLVETGGQTAQGALF